MRFALFGAGRAGTIHARNIAAHPRAELAYIFDVDQAAAQQLVDARGGQVPRDPLQIWEADDVDAVLIASSTDTHVDLLRQAMRAGKPAYCEKPIDLDIEKVRTFVDAASANDPPVFVGFRRRFQPEFSSMQRQVRDGAIGRIESIRIIARDFALAPLAFLQRSGGLLRDKMIHYFDLAPWLAAERPTELYATGSNLIDPVVGEMGDVDTAVALLRFPSGALCTIENGRRAVYGFDDRVEIFGAEGHAARRLRPPPKIWPGSPRRASRRAAFPTTTARRASPTRSMPLSARSKAARPFRLRCRTAFRPS